MHDDKSAQLKAGAYEMAGKVQGTPAKAVIMLSLHEDENLMTSVSGDLHNLIACLASGTSGIYNVLQSKGVLPEMGVHEFMDWLADQFVKLGQTEGEVDDLEKASD